MSQNERTKVIPPVAWSGQMQQQPYHSNELINNVLWNWESNLLSGSEDVKYLTARPLGKSIEVESEDLFWEM